MFWYNFPSCCPSCATGDPASELLTQKAVFGVFSCGKVNSLSLCLAWFYFAAACGEEVNQVTRREELCGKCGFLLQNPFRENALGNILQKTR